jgi:TonB family protein
MIFTALLLPLLALGGAQVRVPLPTPPPPADGMVRLSFMSWPDGTLEIWDIERSRYDALPVWNPTAGPVPLTLSEALKAAEAWLTRQNPDVKSWVTTNTTLAPGVGGKSWSYRVTLAPEGTAVGDLTVPGASGRFSLLVLLDGSVVEPKKIQGAPITQTALPRQPVQDPTGVYRAGVGVLAPRVIESPKPKYSAAAMRARIQGQIRLSCIVNTDGRCEDIKIVQSLDRDNGLDDEAVNTLRQWRFAPGTLDGQPVKVFVNVELWFNLQDKK